jgi:hypothetical protein
MSGDHLLLYPKQGVTLAIFGAFGVGASLMSPQLFFIGLIICVLSAIAAIWLHFREFSEVRKRPLVWRKALELTIVAFLVILEITVPAILLINRTSEEPLTRKIVEEEVQKGSQEILKELKPLIPYEKYDKITKNSYYLQQRFFYGAIFIFIASLLCVFLLRRSFFKSSVLKKLDRDARYLMAVEG